MESASRHLLFSIVHPFRVSAGTLFSTINISALHSSISHISIQEKILVCTFQLHISIQAKVMNHVRKHCKIVSFGVVCTGLFITWRPLLRDPANPANHHRDGREALSVFFHFFKIPVFAMKSGSKCIVLHRFVSRRQLRVCTQDEKP